MVGVRGGRRGGGQGTRGVRAGGHGGGSALRAGPDQIGAQTWRLQTQRHASFPGMQRSDLQAAAEDRIRDPDSDRFDGRRREVVSTDYMSWYARATFSPRIPRRPESFIGAIMPF